MPPELDFAPGAFRAKPSTAEHVDLMRRTLEIGEFAVMDVNSGNETLFVPKQIAPTAAVAAYALETGEIAFAGVVHVPDSFVNGTEAEASDAGSGRKFMKKLIGILGLKGDR